MTALLAPQRRLSVIPASLNEPGLVKQCPIVTVGAQDLHATASRRHGNAHFSSLVVNHPHQDFASPLIRFVADQQEPRQRASRNARGHRLIPLGENGFASFNRSNRALDRPLYGLQVQRFGDIRIYRAVSHLVERDITNA